MNHIRYFAALAIAGLTAPVAAQSLTVDYPDSTIEAPRLLFPFYTLGSGGTVRYQTQCPSTFANLPTQPMIATKVGIQIADQQLYTRFEIRFGATSQQSLTNTWEVNLPDQRLQADLSGTVLQGGLDALNQPVNQWVEYDLAFPFVYTPGENLTLDIISSAAAPGAWCNTAVGTHERLYDAPYMMGPTGGTISPTSGLKMRIVFEPLGSVAYGAGCAGTGGFVPTSSSTGSALLGGSMTIDLADALGGAPAFLMLGFSNTSLGGIPLPIPFGNGCELLTSTDVSFATSTSGAGAGVGTASIGLTVPNDPGLDGVLFYTQYALFDPASPAFGITVSNALTTPIYN